MNTQDKFVTIGDLLKAIVDQEGVNKIISESLLINNDVSCLSLYELLRKEDKDELELTIIDTLYKLTFNINVLLHHLLDGNVEQYGYDYFTSNYNIRRTAKSDSTNSHYEIRHAANFAIFTAGLNNILVKDPSFVFIISTLNKIIMSNKHSQLLTDYVFNEVPELYNPNDVISIMVKTLDKSYPDIKYYHVKHLTGEYLQINEVAIVNDYETGATLRPKVMVDPLTIRREDESPKERKGYNLLSFLLNTLI